MANNVKLILTTYGNEQILKAIADDTNVILTGMAYGDGGGYPYTASPSQTALVNQLGILTNITKQYDNSDGFIYFKSTIPASSDTFTIRELGLIDNQNKLIAIATIPDTQKPSVEDGIEVSLPVTLGFKTSVGEVMLIDTGLGHDYPTMEYLEENYYTIQQTEENFQLLSEKGQSNGYCPLGDDGIVPEQYLPETGANKDLSNLTSFGNSRLYYQPFAINSGTVSNGENATLYAPGSGTVIQTFVQPTLTSDGTMGVSDFACISDYGTAYYAFDGNAETYAGIYGGNSLGCTVTFYSKNPLNITNLVIDGYQNLVTVAYSDDNDSWIQCANVSGILGSSTVVNITNDIGYHNYYRVSTRNTAGTTNAILHQIHITATEEVLVSTADTIYCDTCTCTTADGRTKEFTTTSSLDVSEVADGNYSILKDYTTGALSLESLTISPKEPTSPSSSDYWLDNSQLPLVLKNYSNSEWVTDNSKILLGKCTISSSVVTALTNRRFNHGWNIETPHIVETYKNGSSWYRVYSDGWCEQGGIYDNGSNSRSYTTNITFLKNFQNADYNICATAVRLDNSIDCITALGVYNKTVSGINIRTFGISGTDVSRYLYWVARGYIA